MYLNIMLRMYELLADEIFHIVIEKPLRARAFL